MILSQVGSTAGRGFQNDVDVAVSKGAEYFGTGATITDHQGVILAAMFNRCDM